MNDKELGDVWGLILKVLRSRFHFSLPTGLKSGRSERIMVPNIGSADPPIYYIYDPVGGGILGKIFHKIHPDIFKEYELVNGIYDHT